MGSNLASVTLKTKKNQLNKSLNHSYSGCSGGGFLYDNFKLFLVVQLELFCRRR